MKNENNIEQFDELLKQSVEGFQMPVPNGVWESVGASIGSKAVVVSKAAFIKSVIFKAVAGVVLSGGIIYGAYVVLSDSKVDETPGKEQIISAPSTIIQDSFESKEQVSETTIDSKSASGNTAVSSTSAQTIIPNYDSGLVINQSHPQIPNEVKTNKSEAPAVNNIVKTETEKTPDKETKQVINENNPKPAVPEQIIPPNVFTPYELDGFNDCYKIPVDNTVNYVLQIFDTNGNKVFESNDKDACWDGKNRNTGIMCPKGFYVFKLNYELKTGYKRTLRGELNLL